MIAHSLSRWKNIVHVINRADITSTEKEIVFFERKLRIVIEYLLAIIMRSIILPLVRKALHENVYRGQK